jgi:hypothetical protein
VSFAILPQENSGLVENIESVVSGGGASSLLSPRFRPYHTLLTLIPMPVSISCYKIHKDDQINLFVCYYLVSDCDIFGDCPVL